MNRICWLVLLFGLVFQGCRSSQLSEESELSMVSPTPPMGWNSFDAYDSAINEDQFRQTVEFMQANLLEFGWNYAVIDYIWFNPAPGNWKNPDRRFGHPDLRLDENGIPIDKLTMDEYGRLLPSIERFPSAADGMGFKTLSDWVHSKGMKFGIHIMRGIPRQAFYERRPVLGTERTAEDIAEPWDTCPWNNNMFGVDPTKKGAQEYYDSLFQLYASWGVDYVKADDMIYPTYHRGELEMIRKAIDKCGRPMVLSLSPGEAPLSEARHLVSQANLWRLSADFWDEWDKLKHNFDLLNAWSSYIGPNSWPDADMLPIGHISLGGRPHGPDRQSQFTREEHYTLLSLWCIARSPLMMGGDLLSSSPETIQFLQNPEVLKVNQSSVDNRQIFKTEESACWIAADPKSGDRYLALFNLSDEAKIVEFDFELEYLRERYRVRDLWQRQDVGTFQKKFAVELGPHGAGLYRLSAE